MLTIELENNIYQMPEKIFLISLDDIGNNNRLVDHVSITNEYGDPTFLLQPEAHDYWSLRISPKMIRHLRYIEYTRFESIKAFL
jgi:hypothetical protein